MERTSCVLATRGSIKRDKSPSARKNSSSGSLNIAAGSSISVSNNAAAANLDDGGVYCGEVSDGVSALQAGFPKQPVEKEKQKKRGR